MTLVVCAGILAFSLYFSWRLGRFLKEIDERHEEFVIIDLRKASIVAEAEQIAREAAES